MCRFTIHQNAPNGETVALCTATLSPTVTINELSIQGETPTA
jgi:hypothetical protein